QPSTTQTSESRLLKGLLRREVPRIQTLLPPPPFPTSRQQPARVRNSPCSSRSDAGPACSQSLVRVRHAGSVRKRSLHLAIRSKRTPLAPLSSGRTHARGAGR